LDRGRKYDGDHQAHASFEDGADRLEADERKTYTGKLSGGIGKDFARFKRPGKNVPQEMRNNLMKVRHLRKENIA